jgi:hypothetical protein
MYSTEVTRGLTPKPFGRDSSSAAPPPEVGPGPYLDTTNHSHRHFSKVRGGRTSPATWLVKSERKSEYDAGE